MPSKTPLAQGTKTCYLQLVFGAIPGAVRERSAKPLCIGSNPIGT